MTYPHQKGPSQLVKKFLNVEQIYRQSHTTFLKLYTIEELEDKILKRPNPQVLQEINSNKMELNYFRKSIRPAKEGILLLKKTKSKLMSEDDELFFDDLYDLAEKAHDSVENYKNMLSEQLSVYSINVNNRLNDIMKVLTIFSAIFIPLTFIAGIYGTNFDHLPELHYENSYYIMLISMAAVAVIMLVFFKFKKWF